MEKVKYGEDFLYSDEEGPMMVVNKATAWLVFSGDVTRNRARAYLKLIKSLKNKCGLNDLRLVKGKVYVGEDKLIHINGMVGNISLDIDEKRLMALVEPVTA
jgi:hypothetical protein